MSTSDSLAADLVIRLQPKQSDLWHLWDESPYTRIGFGGARGGAKSGGGRRCMLLRRLKYPCTTGLIIRRTHPQLYKSHLIKLFEEFPPTRHWYNDQRKELIFPNGSRLFFGSAEHPGDISAFDSAEFADIMPDEGQEFSQGELERLSAVNRCTSNPDIVPKMLITFMPGMSADSGVPPKGLQYLKRVFVDGKLSGDETKEKWAFLQAFSWDNIEWARKELGWSKDENGRWQLDPKGVSEEEFYAWPEAKRQKFFIESTEYGRKLNAITNVGLKNAWLYGKWDTFEGQFFQNFSHEKHTIPAHEFQLQKWHKRWISCDWGDDHPSCVHWHAQDEKGVITTYREIWGREIGEENLGRRIGEAEAKYIGEGYQRLAAFWMSWDAFGKLNKETRKSITNMIGEALPPFVPKPVSAGNDRGSRISGWRLMDQLLDQVRWKIVRPSENGLGCPQLIECIPSLVRDMERNTEDVLKVDYSENYIGDDPADCARYGLQNMVSVSIKPEKVLLEERLQATRQQFVKMPEKSKPGTDWFQQFGGAKAKSKQ